MTWQDLWYLRRKLNLSIMELLNLDNAAVVHHLQDSIVKIFAMNADIYIEFEGYDPSEKVLEVIRRQISYVYFAEVYTETTRKGLEGLISEIFMIHGIVGKPHFTWNTDLSDINLTIKNTELHT